MVMIKFEVADTGIGIQNENLKKLFKLFGTLKMKKGINETGTGLGLTICKSISQKLGGSIKIESEYQQGTKVTCLIPVKIQQHKMIRKVSENICESYFEADGDF